MRRLRHDANEVWQCTDQRLRPTRQESVGLARAVGRWLAGPVVAACDVPAFPRAAMDGFALRAADISDASPPAPCRLRLVGIARPGVQPGTLEEPRTAFEIRTGARLPDGADAIVRLELADRSDNHVVLSAPVPVGRDVVRIGEDVGLGEVLLAPPRRLRPQDAAVAAAVGLDRLTVYGTPRVRLLVTGNELVPFGRAPAGEQIVDTNSLILRSAVLQDGGELPGLESTEPVRILPDDRSTIRAAVQAAAREHDLVLLSGGTSVGAEDHAPDIVRELGELPLHGVALRPGAPMGLGFVEGTPVFLVPGSPAACLCVYDLFVFRALERLAGGTRTSRYATRRARLATSLTSTAGRLDYARVRFVDDGVVPLSARGGTQLSSTTRADGYVLVPPQTGALEADVEVDVYCYDSIAT